jgi:hypothetical protein
MLPSENQMEAFTSKIPQVKPSAKSNTARKAERLGSFSWIIAQNSFFHSIALSFFVNQIDTDFFNLVTVFAIGP